jgi:Fur family transcriptional regulator, stress-responsive regulator
VSPLDDLIEMLRAHGLRLTSPRVAVLAALRELPGHSNADEVAALARARLGTLSMQAVYDILGAFAEADIVRRIAPDGGPALYEMRVGDNHHHLVCRRCGAVQDTDCIVGEAPCMQPSDSAGYRVDEAEVVFWGLCPECSSQEDATNERALTRSD